MTDDVSTRWADASLLDRPTFRRRAREDAERLKAALDDGVFDNPQAIVGLEYEFYGAAVFPERTGGHAEYGPGQAGTLQRVPRWLLELIGFEKELGLHNAEMSTSPQPLNEHGLAAQQQEVQARLTAALRKTRAEGIRLVSDGMWTVPPVGESARSYLTDGAEVDGVVVGTNLSKSLRYHGFANVEYEPRFELDAPHVSLSADHAALESLITSIQPHYQVPDAEDLHEHFNYALRVAAPLLALGVNSPFYPPDLYDDVPPTRVLEDGHDEHRIGVFETVLNPRDGPRKVRFPEDLPDAETAVDRLVEDPVAVPLEPDADDRFDGDWPHLRHKHGTFWRWVRPVFEGATPSDANARIEFRPLPGQPTVRDSVAFQAAFAGLMESLPRREHPVSGLAWDRARENFYGVVEDGLDADVEWITAAGETTSDLHDACEEVLEYARDGLELRGLSTYEAETRLRPLRERLDLATTPADWKRDRVRERLDDGDDLADAVHGMQRAYLRRQADTLVGGTFADWLRG